jgi:hypothetical protein
MRLAALLLMLGGSASALPGPAPRAHDDATIRKNASCAGCHPDVAAEWESSLHHQAWVDPVFQSAYEIEPLPFCRGCHAPESDSAREPTTAAKHLGVGCVTCHVENGQVVGAKDSPNALHPVFADARMATEKACASCHQFDFPSLAYQKVPEPMQDTVQEHARSKHSTEPCQSCHMPVVDGPDGKHKSHRFAVISDPAMLRGAARVAAARTDGGLTVTLTPDRVGHAFPTGDMFRRLEVRAEAVDARGRVIVAAEPVVMGRLFDDVPRDPHGSDLGFQRVQVADTRVQPDGAAVVPVRVAAPAGTRLRWRVVYQRMSTPMASAFGVSQVLDEITVAEGEMS